MLQGTHSGLAPGGSVIIVSDWKSGTDQSIDISVMNIMATTPKTVLTELPETLSRKGTIIDWNYRYPVPGKPTSRQIRSGTPAFMALELLNKFDDPVRRTIGHDLESFFAVILYVAVRYENEKWHE